MKSKPSALLDITTSEQIYFVVIYLNRPLNKLKIWIQQEIIKKGLKRET